MQVQYQLYTDSTMPELNRVDELPSELRKRIEATEERIAALKQAPGNSSGARKVSYDR